MVYCIFFKAIDCGWKPGAITKKMLRKLNRAKENTETVMRLKPYRKAKKRLEDKPALIVAKRNGEYIVEMQVNDTSAEGPDHSKPLIYKIASANNEEKVRKRQRRTQRLIDEACQEIFANDPYHPEVCETKCMKAYKQAIGILPFDPNNPECICPEHVKSDEGDEGDDGEEVETYEDDSTDCSSLDLDWEIHFTPPNINRN